MSIWVTCYIEAKIDGVWHSIDLYSKVGSDLVIAPILEGQSYVREALRFYDVDSRIQYDELSAELKANRKYCEYTSWSTIPGKWFESKRFDVPERVGYLPRQVVLDYYAGDSYGDLETYEDQLISYEAFRHLTPGEQMAFQYIEFTPIFGPRDTMNRISNAMYERIRQYNAYPFILSEDRRTRVCIEDTRLIIETR